jgi:hypothetical protein
MTPYQILTPLISFIAIAYAWNLVMRQKKTIWEASLWTFFWGGIGYIALVPGSIDYLTAATGIQDRVNAVLITMLGILAFVVFYLVVRLTELEQRQTNMIRKMALRDAKLGSGEAASGKQEAESNS